VIKYYLLASFKYVQEFNRNTHTLNMKKRSIASFNYNDVVY